MSVYPTEIIVYGSANMPEADSLTVGGAVDLTRRIGFMDGSGVYSVVSSSASDTATKISASGRSSTGAIQNEVLTLNGTTKVTGSLTHGRLLYGALSGATSNGPLANPGGTAAVGDVAYMNNTLTITAHTAQTGSANPTGTTPALFKLQSGDGATLSTSLGWVIRLTGGTGSGQLRRTCSTSGTGAGQYGTDIVAVNRPWSVVPDNTTTYEVASGFLFELLPNPVTAVIRHFATAYADVVGGSSLVFYEKVGILNTDATSALVAASIIKQVDPAGLYSASGALDIALVTALNDTGTIANRQTAPSFTGTSFTSGAAPQTAGATPTLNSGNSAAQAQMMWMRLTLAAGTTPSNGFDTIRVQGTTI